MNKALHDAALAAYEHAARHIGGSLSGYCLEASAIMAHHLRGNGFPEATPVRRVLPEGDGHWTVRAGGEEFDPTVGHWADSERPDGVSPDALHVVGPTSPVLQWRKDRLAPALGAFEIARADFPEAFEKALGDTLLKGGATYFPPGFSSLKVNDRDLHFKTVVHPSGGPRPTIAEGDKPFSYKSWDEAHAAALDHGVALAGGHVLPQGLWDDEDLMPIAQEGWRAKGHRWYREYNGMLDRLASGSGIHRERVMDSYGLNGQGSDTPTNLRSTMKAFSRHHAGLYGGDIDAWQAAGIIKPMFTAEPASAAQSKAISGAGIDTKKLKAYARGFRDSDLWHPSESPYGHTPAADVWMKRLFVGGNDPADSDEMTSAVTGRLRGFMQHWHEQHPDRPLNETMMQAMLWTGYKRTVARHLAALADHIEAEHSDKPNLMATVGRLRADARDAAHEGNVHDTWEQMGLDPDQGLPKAASHDILARYAPEIHELAKSGAIHADYWNGYRMRLPDAPGATLEQKRGALKRWQEATGEPWGHVNEKGELWFPKLKAEEFKKSLLEHGISIFGNKRDGSPATAGKPARDSEGPATVTTFDDAAVNRWIEENPQRAHALATLPLTFNHLESLEKAERKAGRRVNTTPKLLWGDYGVLVHHLGSLAADAGYGSVHPEPLRYGAYKGRENGYDYSSPRDEDARKAVGPAGDDAGGGARGGKGAAGTRHVSGLQDGEGDDGGPRPASGRVESAQKRESARPLFQGGPPAPVGLGQIDAVLAVLGQIEDGIAQCQVEIAAHAKHLTAKLPDDVDHAYLKAALGQIALARPERGDWSNRE